MRRALEEHRAKGEAVKPATIPVRGKISRHRHNDSCTVIPCPRKLPKPLSELEERFAMDCSALKMRKPEREFRFCSGRRWAFDFAWPVQRLAVECEGGHWSHGRHTRGSGFEKDC